MIHGNRSTWYENAFIIQNERYYDSDQTKEKWRENAKKYMTLLFDFISYCGHETKAGAVIRKEWDFIEVEKNDIPQQMNGNDCGVFAIVYAECILRKTNMSELFLTEDNVNEIRERMKVSIIGSTLLQYPLVHNVEIRLNDENDYIEVVSEKWDSDGDEQEDYIYSDNEDETLLMDDDSK